MNTPPTEPWDFGRDVRGYRWRAPESRASLLLQHGYAEYAERYVARHNRLIPHLVSTGFDVHAFDMQGHGRSPGVRGAADIERAVQDHQAARRLLQNDNRPIYLFGHSLGGLVTAASVARDQRHVAGVVLSAPALLLSAAPAMRLMARGLAMVAPTLGVVAPQPASGISRDPEEVRSFRQDPCLYHGRMPVILAATALAVADDSWPRYRRWQVPTLTLQGSNDTFTDKRGSDLFYGLIRSPARRLERVEGGRHELLNDHDRERVLDTVLAWLRLHLN